jgi:hypothetical protein
VLDVRGDNVRNRESAVVNRAKDRPIVALCATRREIYLLGGTMTCDWSEELALANACIITGAKKRGGPRQG